MDRAFGNAGKVIDVIVDPETKRRVSEILHAEPKEPCTGIVQPGIVTAPFDDRITSELWTFANISWQLRNPGYGPLDYRTSFGRVGMEDYACLLVENRQTLGPTAMGEPRVDFGSNRNVEYLKRGLEILAGDADTFFLCGKVCTALGVNYLVDDPGDPRSWEVMFCPEVAKMRADGRALGDKGRRGADINEFHKENQEIYDIPQFKGSKDISELVNLVQTLEPNQICLAALMCEYFLGSFTHWVAILGMFHAPNFEQAAAQWRTPIRQLAAESPFDVNRHPLDQGFLRIAGDASPWGITETPVVLVSLSKFMPAWANTMGADFGVNPAVLTLIGGNRHINLGAGKITANYGVLTLKKILESGKVF
jgi:hypothetical protein